MTELEAQTLYSRSGGALTRSVFCMEMLRNIGELSTRKILFLFDSKESLTRHIGYLQYLQEKNIRKIETITDLLRYKNSDCGYFAGTVGMFNVSLRLDYLERQNSMEILRTAVLSSRDCIERLIELWYEHSPHVSRPYTYHVQGSELKIRETEGIIQISYFDDEIDDILVIEEERTFRKDAIRLYKKNPEPLPESMDWINDLSWDIVWTFDLEFCENRTALREHFTQSFGFESTWTSLDVLPIVIDSMEEFGKLLRNDGERVSIYTSFPSSIQRYLDHNNLHVGELREIPKLKWESGKTRERIYLTDDILGHLFVEKRSRKQTLRSLDLLLTLKPGDFVVHQEHGIGKFSEIVEKTMAWTKREYVSLEYAKGDRLYVPITELYRITKYLWDEHPELHELGGTTWKKTLKDTEAEVLKIAEDLLDLHARRKISKGFAFQSFPKEEADFRKKFPYEHTRDQVRAIEEIFQDMEQEEPMDRLLCWDVGFGKTEVAMNAAYKAVLSGKQVAVISPLVVLTLEHYESFRKRFDWTGIKIAGISRLSTEKEVREILSGLWDGSISIVIGTHRLLGNDVRFKRLGLLVIDEEHRFWVIDKEKIKKIRSGIDILSLSATPIPRSLNLSLSGLKKLSILTTPPPRKKPIWTQVVKWDENTLKSAIDAELDRSWQVIFLHNRVASLKWTAEELKRIAGKRLKPILLHGQMPSHEIEDTLLSFRAQEANCLISTTVIENGVNFLEANTIIIDHADEFGLAQLHQLRGRVGRKDKEAHCLLVYRKESLPEDSKKRLISLVEHSHLWAGFEIAMRDLEIRGAGEILGIAQSGKSKDTGISLYLKLLETKMEELQTGTPRRSMDIKIELDLEFVLPDSLFNGEVDKIHFYRSLEGIDTIEELDIAKESFTGTHWDSPDLHNLFLLLRVRILLSEYRVCAVKKVLKDYVFDFNGATTEDIRHFLEIDKSNEFLVQSLERVRVAQNAYTGDLDFLSKLVYSLEHV